MMKQIVGYVYDEKGKYSNKYYFYESTENISNFVIKFADSKITLTDTMDLLIMKVSNGIILDCCDSLEKNKIQQQITDKQNDEEKVKEMYFEKTEHGVMEHIIK